MFEHYIGRLSEEFGGMPCSQVIEELERLPAGFMEQVIEYRRFAETVAALDRANTPEARQAINGMPMVDIAEAFEFELADAEMKEAHG